MSASLRASFPVVRFLGSGLSVWCIRDLLRGSNQHEDSHWPRSGAFDIGKDI